MQTVQLHFFEKTELPALQTTQGDVGRKFQAVITDGTLGYKIPEDARFSLWYTGTSGEGNYTDIGQRSAFSVSGNTVTVELIAQMLTCPGGGELSLRMSRPDGSRLGLWRIPYQVEPLPGANSPEAEAYYNAFAESMEKLDQAVAKYQIDPGLTEAGQAADAAAVGTALALKAPGGCGYGDTLAFYNNNHGLFDTTLGAVWSAMNDQTARQIQFHDQVGLGSEKFVGTLWRYSNDSGVLEAVSEAGLKAIKCRKNGVWEPWEWVDPPMDAATEYRTTQRHRGYPVYVQLLDLGNLPANGEKTLTHNLGITPNDFVKAMATAMHRTEQRYYPLPMVGTDGSICATICYNAYDLKVKTFTDLSDYTGQVYLYYTRS